MTNNSQSNATEPRKRRWVKQIMVLGAIVSIAVATLVYYPRVNASDDLAADAMTHTIKRGDLDVSVLEQGTLESSDNTEIKCKVRGENTVIWVVENGTVVQPGDELVRLDTLAIEEEIAERTKFAHWSRSAAERSEADVAASKLAISEYLEGRFEAELMTLKKDMAIAQSNLTTARNMREHTAMMFERGYVAEQDLKDRTFQVEQAELSVKSKQTEIDVLEKYTKEMELATLRGNLDANTSRNAADVERVFADEARRDRALEELKHCVVKADRAGLVVYPSAAAWKAAPDVAEGATVHMDQVLLLMPDLTKMQVKIGIHESMIDRLGVGQKALVKLPDRILEAEVTSVATVTRPAGWWTGNVVKYDTIVALPNIEGLKPGMSAEVEVVLAEHRDVILSPVSAILETVDGDFCWVKSPTGPQKRRVELGDTNDIFIIVKSGLGEGDEVILNPMAYVEEAQGVVLKPHDEEEAESNGSENGNEPSADMSSQPSNS